MRCICTPTDVQTDDSALVDAQVIAVRHQDHCPARSQRVTTLAHELRPELAPDLVAGIAEALEA